MKILHISDTHLGARPRGSIERERDIYEVFLEIIDIAIENKVDAVLHAGDMFHSAELFPTPYIYAIAGLDRLRQAGIAFYIVAGNHDAAKPTRNSPLELLGRLGYAKVLSDHGEPGFDRIVGRSGDVIEIHGYSYKALDRLLSQGSKPKPGSILLAHVRLCDAWSQRYGRDQSICSSEKDIVPTIQRLPKGFSYYALGDLHKSWRNIYEGSPAIYPGSPEAISRDDYEEQKVVFLVEIDKGRVDVREIPLKKVRPWINIEARDYSEAIRIVSTDLENIAKKHAKPPIVVLKIKSPLSKNERISIVRVLDSLVEAKKILRYEGPEVEAPQTRESLGIGGREILQTELSIEKAVEKLFSDPEVRRFIADEIIKGELDPDKILSRLVDQGLVNKILSEPEIKRHLQLGVSRSLGGRL
ncbi:MAG TPA: exonuclease SbcCD subunit D [Sulfolobales archaeon]|nr:exonuclease SbcCD subunit D [Sulfolobales archaeon]